MKTIYYSVFLIILTLSAASNNNTHAPAHFVRLKELHTLGGSLALGQVTNVYNRIEGDGKYFGTDVVLGHNSSLRIYPGRGLAFAATLLEIDKKVKKEWKQKMQHQQMLKQNQELAFRLQEAEARNERLVATVKELRQKNTALSFSSSDDQFSTPPSSPTSLSSKQISKNSPITLTITIICGYILALLLPNQA